MVRAAIPGSLQTLGKRNLSRSPACQGLEWSGFLGSEMVRGCPCDGPNACRPRFEVTTLALTTFGCGAASLLNAAVANDRQISFKAPVMYVSWIVGHVNFLGEPQECMRRELTHRLVLDASLLGRGMDGARSIEGRR